MQRILWLSFCLLVIAGVTTQAHAARHQDDGFNPMNMMSDIPGPMNMFDSSDRRRDRRRYRPPPPPPAPAFGYGGYPAYARPPHAYPHTQQGGRPLPGGANAGQPAPQTRPDTAPTAKGVHVETPRSQTPAYSFRPVPPVGAPAPTTAPRAQTATEEPRLEASHPVSSTRLLKPMPERSPNEPVLINGKPAVFRPMNQDSTNNQ